MTPDIPENYYKDLISNTVDKVHSQTKIDPYAPVEIESSLFKRYKDLTVMPSDVYGGKEVDNRYSLTQSFFDRTANDIKVFGANAGTMFVSALWTLPDILLNMSVNKSVGDNLRALGDTPFQQNLFDWRKGVEENSENFNTAVDDETGVWNTIKNTMLPGWYTGSSKGWGELFRSAGYGVGTAASFMIPGGGITGLVGKTLGATGRALGITKGIGKFPNMLNQVVYSLNNSKNFSQVGGLIDDVVNTSINLNRTIQSADVANKLGNAAKFMHRGLIGAYGEAAFEGLEGEHAVIDELTQKFIGEKGYSPTGKELEGIKNIAKDARTARFYMNLGMLGVSNTYQMGRIFRHIDHQKETLEAIGRKGLKIDVVDGKAVAGVKKPLRGDWWEQGFGKKLAPTVGAIKSIVTDPKGIFLESLSEGAEEWTQTAIEKAVNSYSEFRYNNKGKYGVSDSLKFIGEGLSGAMSEEGLKAFLSGAMVGAGQQLVQSAMTLPGTLRNKVARADELNKTLGAYDSFKIEDAAKAMNVDSVRGTVVERVFDTQAATNVNEAFENTTDTKTYKDLDDLNFYNIAKPYLLRGHADVLKQQFKYSVDNFEGEISEMFNTKSSKEEVISSFNKKIDTIAKSFKVVTNSFRNPYNPNSSDEKERQSAFLFNEGFIPEIAYAHYRLGRLTTRLNEINNEIGPLYEEFRNTTEEKNTPKLKNQIEKRIKELEEAVKTPETSQQLSWYKKSLDSLNNSIKEENPEEKFNKYNGEFLYNYSQATALYTGIKIEELEMNAFMNKVKDVSKLKIDLDFVNKSLSKFRNAEYLEVAKANYLKGVNDFNKVQEDDRVRKVFWDRQKYEAFADEAYTKYVTNGMLSEEEFATALKGANTTIEDLTNHLDELSNIESKRDREIKDFVLDWIDKLSHLKTGNTYEEILNVIQTVSKQEKPILTDELKEKVEKILSERLPVKKEKEEKSKLSYYDEFKVEVADYLGEDVSSLLRENIDDLSEYTLKLFEVIDRVEFSKLSLQQQINILNIAKKYFSQSGIKKEIDAEIGKLEKGEPAFEQYESFTIVKDSRGYTVMLPDSSKTFNTRVEAINFIESIKPIVSEGINNIENKFENGVWNPVPRSLLTPEEREAEDNEAKLRREILTSLKENKTDAEFYSIVGANTEIEYQSFDNGKIPEKLKTHVGGLSEGVFGSTVVDTIQLVFNDGENKFKYQTIKNPKESLRFGTKEQVEKRVNAEKDGKFIISSAAKRASLISEMNKYDVYGKTYHQLLVDAESNLNARNIFNLLVSTGTTSFKGNSSQQLNIINKHQEIFDDLKKNAEVAKYVSNNYNVGEVFQSLRDKIEEQEAVIFSDLNYPFAKIPNGSGGFKNERVYFEFPEQVASDKFNINFMNKSHIGDKQVLSLITQSVSNKLKNNPGFKIFKGFYMLTTDSGGTPFIHILRNKPVSVAEIDAVMSDGSLTKKEKLETFAIIDGGAKLGNAANRNFGIIQNKEGVFALSFTYTPFSSTTSYVGAVNIPESVFQDGSNFLEFLEKVENKLKNKEIEWKDKITKEPVSFNPSIETKILVVPKTETGKKPASIQDVLDTRMVSAISRKQFYVTKFTLTPKQTEVKVKPDDTMYSSYTEVEDSGNISELDVASFSSFIETPVENIVSTEGTTVNYTKTIEDVINNMLPEDRVYYNNVNRDYLNTFFSQVFSPEEVSPNLINFVLHAFIGEKIKNGTIPIVLNELLDKTSIVEALIESPSNQDIIEYFVENDGGFSKRGVLLKKNEIDFTKEIENLINYCR